MSEMPPFNPNMGSQEAYDQLAEKRAQSEAAMPDGVAARQSELLAQLRGEQPAAEPTAEASTPEADQQAA